MDTLCKFSYLGRELEISAVEEEWPMAAAPGPREAAPGQAGVTLGPITLSAGTIAAADTLTLSAQVGGPDVVRVYLELLLRDPQMERYYGPVYREPITAPRTQQVGGVDVPDWRELHEAQVTIRPRLRLLTDGREWALGFVRPRVQETRPAAETGYAVEALYQAAWSFRQHRAQLSFSGTGAVKDALVYRELGGRVGAAPRPVNPRRGDRFTPLLRLYRPASEAGAVEEKAVVRGNMLKWREGLRWEDAPLFPGAYLAGLVAEDLDGQLHRRYVGLGIGE